MPPVDAAALVVDWDPLPAAVVVYAAAAAAVMVAGQSGAAAAPEVVHVHAAAVAFELHQHHHCTAASQQVRAYCCLLWGLLWQERTQTRQGSARDSCWLLLSVLQPVACTCAQCTKNIHQAQCNEAGYCSSIQLQITCLPQEHSESLQVSRQTLVG